jgi:hypothetical protein
VIIQYPSNVLTERDLISDDDDDDDQQGKKPKSSAGFLCFTFRRTVDFEKKENY